MSTVTTCTGTRTRDVTRRFMHHVDSHYLHWNKDQGRHKTVHASCRQSLPALEQGPGTSQDGSCIMSTVTTCTGTRTRDVTRRFMHHVDSHYLHWNKDQGRHKTVHASCRQSLPALEQGPGTSQDGSCIMSTVTTCYRNDSQHIAVSTPRKPQSPSFTTILSVPPMLTPLPRSFYST